LSKYINYLTIIDDQANNIKIAKYI